MPPITPPTITTLPTPPTRSDPASFSERGDAFLGALPTLGTQANALAANVYANAVDAAGSAAGAETARGLAQDAQGAAQLAVQQTLAGTAVAMWAPGTYSQGALAWSPSTRWTYRRHAATGASSVDPAADPGAWALAAPADLPVLTVGSATVTMAAGARYSLTHNAAVTATLPASPQVGSMVAVVASNLRRDNTVARNGQLIEGLAEDLVLNRLGAAIGLAFVGGATGWKIVRFDSLDRSFPLPIDAGGRVLANVAHRTGTLASLLALAGTAGEISADPAAGALVLHTGVAGQARQVGSGRGGRLLTRATLNVGASLASSTWAALGTWTELFDPDNIFNPTTGVLTPPGGVFSRITVVASVFWVGSGGTLRRLRAEVTQAETGTVVLMASQPIVAGVATCTAGEVSLPWGLGMFDGDPAVSVRLQGWHDAGSVVAAIANGRSIVEFWGEPL